MPKEAFPAVFQSLRTILAEVSDSMIVKVDQPESYTLETPTNPRDGKPFYFASTVIRKNYVSFYLMSIYTNPELLEGISPALNKRRQGKSCFNFKQIDETLFSELKALVAKSLPVYQQLGYF